MAHGFKKFGLALCLLAGLGFSGCDSSNDSASLAPLGQASPVAVNDTFTALGNATLNQAAGNGVLGNDTPNGGSISSFDAVSAQGGTVAVNADGSFAYTPVFGFTGTDTFSYTLSSSRGASTATVTMNVPNEGFFVDNTQPAGGNGSQASPFNSLAAAIAAASNGDTIFVFRGNGAAFPGPVNLPAGVNLIGEASGLAIAQSIVPSGFAPTLTGPITLGGDNTVSGFTIQSTGGNNGVEGNSVAGCTISQNTFLNDTGRHIFLHDLTSAITVDSNVCQGTEGNYIDVQSDVNNTVTVTNNTCNGDSTIAQSSYGIRVQFGNSSTGTVTVNGNTVASPSTGTAFDDGIEIESQQNAVVTATANNNRVFDVVSDGFSYRGSSGGTLTGTASGNVLDMGGGRGIYTNGQANSTLNVTYDSNIVSNFNEGVQAGMFSSNIQTTFVATNNIVTNCDDGIEMDDSSSGPNSFLAAIRNNQVTGGTESIVVRSQSIGCVDITGNTVDQEIELRTGTGGTLNVERLTAGTGGPLESVNTLNNGATVTQPGTGTVTAQNAGFCGLP